MVYPVPKCASSFSGNSSEVAEGLKKLLQQSASESEPKGNTQLTKEQLKVLFKALGSRLGSWRAWRAMRHADKNGDDFISDNEMEQLFMYCKKHGFLTDKDG